MKNINFNNKIGLGLVLISTSTLFRCISPDHSSNLIAFLQGFTISLGIVFLFSGMIQSRKMSK